VVRSRTGLTFGLLAALAIASALSASPSSAAVPRNGWGFAIADSGSIPAALGPSFARLEPKAFRFMVPWNAWTPQGPTPAVQAAHAVIATARAQGVRQIVVSFDDDDPNSPGVPSERDYATAVEGFVREFAGAVDAWGPVNEPNCGGGWEDLADTAGAQQTAAYYQQMSSARAAWDPTARLLSPDICDTFAGSAAAEWIAAYRAAGGGFGDVIALHPYRDAHAKTLSQTDAVLTAIGEDKPVWATEVGGMIRNANRGVFADEAFQHDRVSWITTVLAGHPRIERVFYYHMHGVPEAPENPWDSGLVHPDSTPRPAWYAWCSAAHDDDPHHPQCGGAVDDRYVAGSCPPGRGEATTIGVFRRSTGEWLVRSSNTPGEPAVRLVHGGPWEPDVDVALACDWDGNGTVTAGVFRRSTGEWLLRNSIAPGGTDVRFRYGAPWGRDLPVVGDWDGDGTATIGVFRRSTGEWLLRNSIGPGAADLRLRYGASRGDVPVVGDWDGEGTATVGVFRRSTGEWLLRNSNSPGGADLRLRYGEPWEPYGDVPVVGDWDGNGTTTIGVFRRWTGEWLLRNSNAAGSPDIAVAYGAAAAPSDDVPAVGDWSGQPWSWRSIAPRPPRGHERPG
jgi:hypothetical protein